ncbi:MAG: hypothetical protein E7231_09505 [Cellulosilyticum sp.]|nr:hypothetical protein [Cellulosilyticum sp.]
MDKIINVLIVISLCVEVFIYIDMFAKAIYLKFIKKYKYLSVTNVLDKICIFIYLVALIGNLIVAIDGNMNSFPMVLMMGFLCYTSLGRILCFENDERVFIQSRMLLKSKTYIANKEYRSKSNVVLIRSEKVSISILVSNKGKEELYNRFGDNVI